MITSGVRTVTARRHDRPDADVVAYLPVTVPPRRPALPLAPTAFAAAVAVVALAGCGGSASTSAAAPSPAASASTSAAPSPSPSEAFAGQSASEILAAAQKAFTAADTTHVVGSFSEDGTDFTMDIRMTADGDAVAKLDVGGLGAMELRTIGGDAWLSGDPSFWKATGAPANLFDNKWIKTTTKSKDFQDFLELTSKKQWAKELLEPGGELKVVAGKEIDGIPTVGLEEVSGEDPGILFVAASGPAYPLAIEPKSGEGSLRFTDWDEPVDVEKPPAKDVVEP